MKKYLGYIKEKDFVRVCELNDNNYLKFKEFSKRLIDYSRENHLVKMVYMNYKNYHGIVTDYFAKKRKGENLDFDALEDIVLNINTCIMNFLSSFRTFLDHTETKFKRKYGEESIETVRFKKFISNIYDSDFSYRFIYKLRNYTQHCGMPIGDISSHSVGINEDTKETKESLHILFNRDELLENYDGWGTFVREELKKQQPKFDINSHIDKAMKHVEEIKKEIILIELPYLLEDVKFLVTLLDKIKKNGDIKSLVTPGVFEFIENGYDVINGKKRKKLKINIDWFPLKVIRDLYYFHYNKVLKI